MGLFRSFTIFAEKKDGSPVSVADNAAILAALNKVYYADWNGNLECGVCMNGVYWINYDENMQSVASLFPDIVFYVYCRMNNIDGCFDACYCGERSDIQYADIPPLDYDFVKGNKEEAK